MNGGRDALVHDDFQNCPACGGIFDLWLQSCGVSVKDRVSVELHELWTTTPKAARFYMLAGAIEYRGAGRQHMTGDAG